MTDEQIKQYAKNSVEAVCMMVGPLLSILPIGAIEPLKELLCYCIEKGAHSRDEEIRELLEKYTYKIDSLIAQKEDLQAELDKLSNPWISVEEMLPAEFKTVIVMFDSGIIINAFVTMVKDEPAWHPSVEIPIGSDVIFWMPIPELKKGGLI